MINLKNIPITIEGYPNFVDDEWYTKYDKDSWYDKGNGFYDDGGEECFGFDLSDSKTKVTEYNPDLNYKIKNPVILSEQRGNRQVPYAIFFQKFNKRFVFDLEGSVHRIVFGGETVGTTRIMTEEEYDAAMVELINQISKMRNKEKNIDLISRISYDSNIDWPQYIQFLVEEEEDRNFELLTSLDCFETDVLIEESTSHTYKFSHSSKESRYSRINRSFQTEGSYPDLILSPSGPIIRYFKNYRMYSFALETGQYQVSQYDGAYNRPMTVEDFDKIIPEMLSKNEDSNRKSEEKDFIAEEIIKLQGAREKGELSLERRTFQKMKK